MILFIFLLVSPFLSEDCRYVSESSENQVGNDLNIANKLINSLPDSPYKSVLSASLTTAGYIFGTTSTSIMECTTDFGQDISEDFQDFYENILQETLEGFDNSLNTFVNSYQNDENFLDTPDFNKKMYDVDSPYVAYLLPLNENMLEKYPEFFQTDNPKNYNGFQLLSMPYAAVYMNLHRLVLTDLFTWSMRKDNNYNYAMSTFGEPLRNQICTAADYISQTYVPYQPSTLFTQRTSQISCTTDGPNCCGTSCCHYTYPFGCNKASPVYNGVLNIADTWRPHWTSDGYPQYKQCFPEDFEVWPDGEVYGSKPWPGWVQQCNDNATQVQNNLTSLMISQLSTVYDALNSQITVYSWMYLQSGDCSSGSLVHPCVPLCIEVNDPVYIFTYVNGFSLLGMDANFIPFLFSSNANTFSDKNIFILRRNQRNNFCIISHYDQTLYLRMDGSSLTSYQPSGGGIANAQRYSLGQDCVGYEEFMITPVAPGGFVIQSVAFPGRFLRIDNEGNFNLQYYDPGVMPQPHGWEVFVILNDISTLSVMEGETAKEESTPKTTTTTNIIVIVCATVGSVVGVGILVVVVYLLRKNSNVFDEYLKSPFTKA